MPRYVVERTFPGGLDIPTDEVGAKTCLDVVRNNAEEHVTWVTSFVSTDRTKTFCVYDGPSPDSVHRAALANGLPVDAVTECRVLDPYFYLVEAPSAEAAIQVHHEAHGLLADEIFQVKECS